ncbi:MAG: hypothetical protein WA902_07295 [Thermosynechococcaceae cyanobacterium]
MDDVLHEFGKAIQIPELSDDDGLLLTAEVLPAAPTTVEAELTVEIYQHSYSSSFYIPTIHFSASKQTYQGLGFLLFAHALGNSATSTRIAVSSSYCDGGSQASILELQVGINSTRKIDDLIPGETLLQALAFNYWPTQCNRHPWWPLVYEEVYSLPWMDVGNEDGFDLRPGEDAFVYGFGSLAGTIRMAELLLNISRAEATCNEYCLEAEPGFRGVAPASTEIVLHLPGSPGYAN